MTIRIPDGNAFRIRLTARNLITGEYTEAADLSNIDNLVINYVRRGIRFPHAYTIDEEGRATVADAGTLDCGFYGIELTGYYGGEKFRFYGKDLFEITTDTTDVIDPSNLIDIEITVKLNASGVSKDYVDHAVNGMEASMETMQADLRDEIAEAGKVDDVKVNGVSVVSGKKANITVPTKVSDLTNDSGYQNEQQVQQKVDAAKITSADISVDGGTGTPSGSAGVSGNKLVIALHNIKGEKGDPGESIVGPQGPQGDSFQPIEDVSGLVLAHTTGQNNTKAMTQKAVTEALITATKYTLEEVDLSEVTENAYFISHSLHRWEPATGTYRNRRCKIVSVSQGRYRLVKSTELVTVYAVLHTNNYSEYGSVDFAAGCTSVVLGANESEAIVDVPSDGAYLYFTSRNDSAVDIGVKVYRISKSAFAENLGDDEYTGISQKAVSDAISVQCDNAFDLANVGLSVSNTTYLGISKQKYGVQVYVNNAYDSGSYIGYIEMSLEAGKVYNLSFDYYSELPDAMTPSMRNSSKAYIGGFKDANGNLYSIPTGSGHAEWTFTAPSGVEYMGLHMQSPLVRSKALWIENITLVYQGSIVTEAFSDFRDKSTEAYAILKAEIDDAKYAMSPDIIVNTVDVGSIKVVDGGVNSDASTLKHTEYLPTNGAKKIAVFVPNIGSQAYGLAFYYRRSYYTFISSVPFSDGSKKYTAEWKIIDVPEGASFFRYTIRPDDEIKYRIVTSTSDLLQVYNNSAAHMIATHIMRSAKVVSDKDYIYTFSVVKMNIVNSKAYVAYFVSETQLDGDVAYSGGHYVCSEIDTFDGSVRVFDVVNESTKYSDGTTASPTQLGYSTTTVTPDGQIADFALMGFGNDNPIYIYAIYDAATRARNFKACRLVYTPSGGSEHDVEFSLNAYRQMLYDMGYANSYVQSSQQYVDNITLGYNADEEVYYSVMCTSQNVGKAVLPIMLMVSEDMATWSPVAKIGESDAGEISAIYKDGKVYVSYRTFNNGMRWIVYDVENYTTISEGKFPVSMGVQGIVAKPDTFTYEGNIYMSVNVDPNIFSSVNDYTDYTHNMRQQIAIYKVVNGMPKFFRAVNNPTGINYYSFCETPNSPIAGQGAIYIAFCEDRRHLYRRQFANIAFADVTALFADNRMIV